MKGIWGASDVAKAISMLCDRGYQAVTVEEGSLGYGHVIMLAPDDNHYNVEIQEVYLNCWSSGHKIRNFRKISKRIEKLLDGRY